MTLALRNPSYPAVEAVKERETAAAITIQSAWRAWKVRQLTVVPRQILPFLEKNLLKNLYKVSELPDIALALCRQINQRTYHPERHLRQGFQKIARDYTPPIFYDLPIFRGKRNLPFSCWIEMPNEKSIDLVIGSDERLGKGTYRSVYKAQTFKVSARLKNKSREVIHIPSVLTLEFDKELDSEYSRTIQKRLESLGNFAKAFKVCSPGKFTREWYNSDLKRASNRQEIPADFQKSSESRPFSKLDSLKVFIDIAKALEVLHREGYIHRDVKPKNILIKWDKEFEGRLSDFDLVTTVGKSQNITRFFEYWDKSCCMGWPLPLADCYGLVISMGETFVPGFFDEIKGRDFKAHLCKTAPLFIENALAEDHPHLYQQLSKQEVSFDKFFDLVAYVETLSQSSYPLQKTALKNLRVELILLYETLRIASHICEQSKAVYLILEKNQDLRRKLTLGSPEERREAAKALEEHYWSASKIREMLESLQKCILQVEF